MLPNGTIFEPAKEQQKKKKSEKILSREISQDVFIGFRVSRAHRRRGGTRDFCFERKSKQIFIEHASIVELRKGQGGTQQQKSIWTFEISLEISCL
jgi:hypothetical protein